MQQKEIEKLILAIDKESAILFAYLFGSQVTNDASPLSDVDVAVYTKQNLNLDERLGIIYRLVKATRMENLDITFLNQIDNLYLLEDIFAKGILLIDKDKDARDYFEVISHHRFLDFDYQRKFYFED